MEKDFVKNCISCGNCAAICPSEAIEFKFDKKLGYIKPVRDLSKCSHCGFCNAVCPAVINKDKQANIDVVREYLIGKYEMAFCGYATDNDLRYCATSGGLLTLMIQYLISEKLADEALIVDFDDNPLVASPKWTGDLEKIRKGTGSKYQVVNSASLLRKVLHENKRYIFVGLPCHLRAFNFFAKSHIILEERVKFKFSLCCSHNVSSNALDFMLHKLNLDRKDIKSFKYRGDGWPSYMKFTTKDNKEVRFNKDDWNNLFLSYFHTPDFCFNCHDVYGEASDISFADAWLTKYTNSDKVGSSLCLVRTAKGVSLCDELLRKNLISAETISATDVIKAQLFGLFHKKILPGLARNRLRAKLYFYLLRFNSAISRKKIFKWVPLVVIKYYYKLIYFLFCRKELKRFAKSVDKNQVMEDK